jgi:hypothetical protein
MDGEEIHPEEFFMVDTTFLPSDVREPVLRELGPDEQLRWFGQPRPMAFIMGSLPLVLFAIPWTGFALFWTYGAAGFRIPDFSNPDPTMLFPLFGLPFILIGLGMLSSPLWALRRASRTAYLITNKRAVIIDGGGRRMVRSITPDRFGDLVRREGRGGRGDIMFGGEALSTQVQEHPSINEMSPAQVEATRRFAENLTRFAVLRNSSSARRAGRSSVPAFIDIENPRQVEELLRTMAGTSW